MDVVSTIPRFIRNGIYHLLCSQVHLLRLPDNKNPRSIFDVLGLHLYASLYQSSILRINIQCSTIKRCLDFPLLLKINHIDASVVNKCNVTRSIYIWVIFCIHRQEIRQILNKIQLQASLYAGSNLSYQAICSLPIINPAHL